MTERSIPECIAVIGMSLRVHKRLMAGYSVHDPDLDDALECLEIIEDHCKRVDAEAKEYDPHRSRPVDAPPPPEQYVTGSKK